MRLSVAILVSALLAIVYSAPVNNQDDAVTTTVEPVTTDVPVTSVPEDDTPTTVQPVTS